MTLKPSYSMPFSKNAFSVGVTGHRPNRLKQADVNLLRDRIRKILKRFHRLAFRAFSEKSPAPAEPLSPPRIITPLAEGADRMVAEEGLSIGYRLYCPLPLRPREYEKDFKDAESRRIFRNLLSKAETVRVVGEKMAFSQRNAAYARAGREVLTSSDVLIAVWDGMPARGVGGTAQIIAEARAMGIPVVWVHAAAPHRIRYFRADLSDAS